MATSRSIASSGVALLALAGSLLSACGDDDGTQVNGSTTRSLSGPAGRLHVDDGGQGTPVVVFLHSFGGSTQQWAAQLAHVRQTRRAIAIDLRGHGRSDARANGDYAVDSLASDVAAVADELDLQRFVLVGHSMGGAAASAYAGKHGDRLAGLVLVGTPGKSSPEMATQVLTAMEADYAKVSEDYWKRLLTDARPQVEAEVRKDMAPISREASLAMIGAIFAYDPLPKLAAYTAAGPILLIDTPHGDGPQALHSQMPALPRRVITGTSHWPHMDKPAEFNAILDEFLVSAR